MAEGFFRSKSGFTVVQNNITRDNSISLKAKGLYLVIQAYITMPDKQWRKEDFFNMSKEGAKAFESAWKELKDTGYLKVHCFPDGGVWRVEYELLDESILGAHTFYYDNAGNLSSNNLDRAEKKKQGADEKNKDKETESTENGKSDRYPPFGTNGEDEDSDHYPHYGSNANGNNGYGSNAKGGNNNKSLYTKPFSNTCNIKPNQNLNPEKSEPVHNYSMDYLEELYEAKDLILMGLQQSDVELVLEILYDAINSTKPYLWVNREQKPTEVVRSRLLKLTCLDIEYAIRQYHKQTTEIRYQKSYMLSLLFAAKGQANLDYTNQVMHDMYGKKGG